MSITLHCEHCRKKIVAADTACGKWGKCPACHNKIYVPGADTGEELKLAPIDANEVARQKKLMAETHKLSQDLLKEKEKPDKKASTDASYKMGDKQLTDDIITYLLHMANGQLDDAERVAEVIAGHGAKGIEILDKIALSDIPEPELADIQPQVLSGLIRTLRARIGQG